MKPTTINSSAIDQVAVLNNKFTIQRFKIPIENYAMNIPFNMSVFNKYGFKD